MVVGVWLIVGFVTCAWVVCCGTGDSDGTDGGEKGLCMMCFECIAAWKANKQSMKDAKVSKDY